MLPVSPLWPPLPADLDGDAPRLLQGRGLRETCGLPAAVQSVLDCVCADSTGAGGRAQVPAPDATTVNPGISHDSRSWGFPPLQRVQFQGCRGSSPGWELRSHKLHIWQKKCTV